jgi:hypothetical protein
VNWLKRHKLIRFTVKSFLSDLLLISWVTSALLVHLDFAGGKRKLTFKPKGFYIQARADFHFFKGGVEKSLVAEVIGV